MPNLDETKLWKYILKLIEGDAEGKNWKKRGIILIRLYIMIHIVHHLIQGVSLLAFGPIYPGLLNIAFFIFDAILFRLVSVKSRKLIKSLCTIGAIVCVILSVYMLGWDIGVQHYIFSIMMFWVVTGNEKITTKLWVGIGLCIMRLLLYVYIQANAPIYMLTPYLRMFLQFSNTVFVFITVLFLAVAFSRETMLIESEASRERLEKAYEEAQRANRAKSDFLSNMSHDIRTPMNAIAGFAAIAKTHMDDQKKLEDCIDKIIISENHLEEIVSDVLDMSRIENGKEDLADNIVSLDVFCNGIATLVSPMLAAKTIEFRGFVEKLEHNIIRSDEAKLRRIMVNILSNAVKYNREGGWVECYLKETDSDKEAMSTYTFRFVDNGIGMSEEFLEHVFDAFTRENAPCAATITGTGLGMTIVKQYVELLGGTIDIKSKQGEGTEVTLVFEFPWAEDEQRIPDEVTDPEFVNGAHILYVDDNELNREISIVMLEELGISVDTASNGKEAVELMESSEDGAYDCILMDIRMPVMGGMEATSIIRSSDREYLKKIPIIAVTANAFVEDEEACLAAGMNGYIPKPFTRDDVVNKLYLCSVRKA